MSMKLNVSLNIFPIISNLITHVSQSCHTELEMKVLRFSEKESQQDYFDGKNATPSPSDRQKVLKRMNNASKKTK